MVNEKILDRIRKLLNLADRKANKDENEVATAAALAQELMRKHRISMTQLELETGQAAEAIVDFDLIKDEGTQSITTWKMGLMNTLAKCNFCRSVLTPKRRGVPNAGKLMVFGKQSDIDAVVYLYKYLVNEIERLCDEASVNLPPDERKRWRSGFRVGAANTVVVRLRAEREQAEKKMDTSTTALVRKADADVQKFIENLYKDNLKNFKRSMNPDEKGYAAGQEAGASINLPGGKERKLGQAAKQLGPNAR